jgi:hypothetical protein
MSEDRPILIADTNTLLNLASVRVDREVEVPQSDDPLKTVLTGYDVHVPDAVVGELGTTAQEDDFLGASAGLVMDVADFLTVHQLDDDAPMSVPDDLPEPAAVGSDSTAEDRDRSIPADPGYGLDAGELAVVVLARRLPADLVATDEVGTAFPTLRLLVEDAPLVTGPHLVAHLSAAGLIDSAVARRLLSYFAETHNFPRGYVGLLTDAYLNASQ